jgi:hypothetical protein
MDRGLTFLKQGFGTSCIKLARAMERWNLAWM